MNPDKVQRLLDINHQFYQTFATSFSRTRQRLQPGVLRLLEQMPLDASILDLGCGNGELARHLHRQGFRGRYLGVDFSPGLLTEAARDLPPGQFTFQPLDLSLPEWRLRVFPPFDRLLAFAVLHHIPSHGLRLRLLAQARQALAPGGFFLHSHWQFLDSPRLSRRIQPWSTVGLEESDLEPSDYLLDWRAGGHGLRYVHLFRQAELDELARLSGFTILDTFLSDGENTRLGLYQVWAPLPD